MSQKLSFLTGSLFKRVHKLNFDFSEEMFKAAEQSAKYLKDAKFVR
jgi:hypothetical protein